MISPHKNDTSNIHSESILTRILIPLLKKKPIDQINNVQGERKI